MAARALASAVSGLLGVLLAAQAVIGLATLAYGAWLAWEPAGYMVAGLGLLADRIVDESRGRPRE